MAAGRSREGRIFKEKRATCSDRSDVWCTEMVSKVEAHPDVQRLLNLDAPRIVVNAHLNAVSG
jgi:hypothetical protein